AVVAVEIDRRCRELEKVMTVLIEVNSGRERQKSGVYPEAVEELVRDISTLEWVKVKGLMTMGPRVGDPEEARPCFVETRKVFEHLAELGLPGVTMEYLSMGMTNSYRVAIEEGANIVRVGSRIFGDRDA
nr:alanine racemase [Dehalococcoidia bacterium]